MALSRISVSAALFVAIASPCLADPQIVIPEPLQQAAMSCIDEAVRICPEVLTAEDHGISCMIGKRSQFSPRCRVVYDQVAHLLKR